MAHCGDWPHFATFDGAAAPGVDQAQVTRLVLLAVVNHCIWQCNLYPRGNHFFIAKRQPTDIDIWRYPRRSNWLLGIISLATTRKLAAI